MARILRLFDNRSLQYLVSGAENGFPLIWLHGTPGACFVSKILETTCQNKGIKLVSLSRAGYGDSTRHQGRQIVSAVADIQALTQNLGIKKCVVAGWSGGGKYFIIDTTAELLLMPYRATCSSLRRAPTWLRCGPHRSQSCSVECTGTRLLTQRRRRE